MKRVLIAAAIVALVAVVARKRSQGQSEWHGMSEEQARERLAERLPNKMPDDAREAVTDKIVAKMRDKGVIIDLTDDAMADAAETPEDAPTTTA